MKIDFSAKMTDLAGEVVKVNDKGEEKDWLLSNVVTNALTVALPGDDKLEAPEKLRMGILAQEVYGKAEIAVSPEDVTLIRERVGKAYGPLVVMKAYELLDSK